MNRETRETQTDIQTPPRPVLNDNHLYLGDNGRCLCGRHSGMIARYTGRDTSGQPVTRVTQAYAAEYRQMAKEEYGLDLEPSCEICGRKA